MQRRANLLPATEPAEPGAVSCLWHRTTTTTTPTTAAATTHSCLPDSAHSAPYLGRVACGEIDEEGGN